MVEKEKQMERKGEHEWEDADRCRVSGRGVEEGDVLYSPEIHLMPLSGVHQVMTWGLLG